MKVNDIVLTTGSNTPLSQSKYGNSLRAVLLAENYCGRVFRKTTNRLSFQVGPDDVQEIIFPGRYPISEATVFSPADQQINVLPMSIAPSKIKRIDDMDFKTLGQWQQELIVIDYTAGYDDDWPDDLAYAIRQLERVMDERSTQVVDRQSFSGELGSESMFTTLKQAIPSELKLILINYKIVAL